MKVSREQPAVKANAHQQNEKTPHNQLDRRVSGAADDALEDLNAKTGPMDGGIGMACDQICKCCMCCFCCPCLVLAALFDACFGETRR